ncbi:MAG: putative manganese-dependent inorganic diphosphatase [Bacilli bacterium]|nr:putative manganese-dependent inorganic diphosphatase [Bacilli bacterium]
MNKTFIFGHKRPDSDAIMSAIGLSYLKNKLGEDTEPRALGSVNKETAYALNYFKLDTPEYLNDVKLQIKDVKYNKDFLIDEHASIYDAYQYMLKEGLTGLPVVKEDKQFKALVTLKDLSRVIINENIEDLYTSYENIMQVLKGEELVRIDKEIVGKVLVAAYRSTNFIKNIELDKDSILIVGDRHSIIEHAVNKGVKLIIISGDNEVHDEHLTIAASNKVNVIRTPYDSYHVAKLIGLTNYIKTIVRTTNPTKFEDTDFVSTVIEVNEKLKHTNYPIVDKDNKCLGLLRMIDLNDKDPKRVILVDHNEPLQSAEGINEAEIVEIIDHHALSSLSTAQPINYRNMAVGSSCTIVYYLFKERNVKIPKKIAGALLSGVLSDTLILKSPTATKLDEEAVHALAEIAGVDYFKYGMEMLKAGTSVEGMTKEQVLYNDYKLFTAGESKFGIGQFFTMNFDEMKKDLDEYVKVLDEEAEQNGVSLMALYITDIIENGSYVIYNSKAEEYMKAAYDDLDVKQGFFVSNCVSRKKNIVPVIMPVFDK